MVLAPSQRTEAAPRRLRILAQIVLSVYAVLGAQAATAQTQGINYNVRIDAPRQLDDLLEDNLDLLRWRGNARVDLEQLQRLVRDTPEQAKALIATEGNRGLSSVFCRQRTRLDSLSSNASSAACRTILNSEPCNAWNACPMWLTRSGSLARV